MRDSLILLARLILAVLSTLGVTSAAELDLSPLDRLAPAHAAPPVDLSPLDQLCQPLDLTPLDKLGLVVSKPDPRPLVRMFTPPQQVCPACKRALADSRRTDFPARLKVIEAELPDWAARDPRRNAYPFFWWAAADGSGRSQAGYAGIEAFREMLAGGKEKTK